MRDPSSPSSVSSSAGTPKGAFNGECNRGACSNTGAVYFNRSTERFYCYDCARTLNRANPEAMELYGTRLCVGVTDPAHPHCVRNPVPASLAGTPEQTDYEARRNEVCVGCGHPRWRHAPTFGRVNRLRCTHPESAESWCPCADFVEKNAGSATPASSDVLTEWKREYTRLRDEIVAAFGEFVSEGDTDFGIASAIGCSPEVWRLGRALQNASARYNAILRGAVPNALEILKTLAPEPKPITAAERASAPVPPSASIAVPTTAQDATLGHNELAAMCRAALEADGIDPSGHDALIYGFAAAHHGRLAPDDALAAFTDYRKSIFVVSISGELTDFSQRVLCDAIHRCDDPPCGYSCKAMAQPQPTAASREADRQACGEVYRWIISDPRRLGPVAESVERFYDFIGRTFGVLPSGPASSIAEDTGTTDWEQEYVNLRCAVLDQFGEFMEDADDDLLEVVAAAGTRYTELLEELARAMQASGSPAVDADDDFDWAGIVANARACVEGSDYADYGDMSDVSWAQLILRVDAMLRAARSPAVDAGTTEAETAALREWKSSVLHRLKQMPEFQAAEWGGDKEGLGFVFEFVGWLHRDRARLLEELVRLSSTPLPTAAGTATDAETIRCERCGRECGPVNDSDMPVTHCERCVELYENPTDDELRHVIAECNAIGGAMYYAGPALAGLCQALLRARAETVKPERVGDEPTQATLWRWAYSLLVTAAKLALALRKAEQREAGEENNWPGRQEWHELVGSSHAVFLREVRELAGIDHDAFLKIVRGHSSLAAIAEEIYNAAAEPTPRAAARRSPDSVPEANNG